MQAGADVNLRNKDDSAPLHLAALFGRAWDDPEVCLFFFGFCVVFLCVIHTFFVDTRKMEHKKKVSLAALLFGRAFNVCIHVQCAYGWIHTYISLSTGAGRTIEGRQNKTKQNKLFALKQNKTRQNKTLSLNRCWTYY